MNGGYPQARWMVDFMANATRDWMIARGTPMTQETSIY